MKARNHEKVNDTDNQQLQATEKALAPTDEPVEAKLMQEALDRERDLNVDSMAYFGLSEIAEQLGHIHNSLRSYTVNATDGENFLNLFTGQHDFPMRLVLEGDAVDTIADSLKRIADTMTATRANGTR